MTFGHAPEGRSGISKMIGTKVKVKKTLPMVFSRKIITFMLRIG